MLVSFVKGKPALMINRERILIASDLHIGNEFKAARSGMHFVGATRRMAEELLGIYKRSRAKGIVLLGDVKESVGYPQRDEFDAIATFFHMFRDIDITMVRGNHDAHMHELLARIGISIYPVKELLTERIALIHGNAMPSESAMKKDYIIAGHSHIAVESDGGVTKGWLRAEIGSGAAKEYKTYNKRIRLVVMPAFNSLITGVKVGTETKWSMPLLRNRVFDPEKAMAYDLNDKLRFKGSGL